MQQHRLSLQAPAVVGTSADCSGSGSWRYCTGSFQNRQSHLCLKRSAAAAEPVAAVGIGRMEPVEDAAACRPVKQLALMLPPSGGQSRAWQWRNAVKEQASRHCDLDLPIAGKDGAAAVVPRMQSTGWALGDSANSPADCLQVVEHTRVGSIAQRPSMNRPNCWPAIHPSWSCLPNWTPADDQMKKARNCSRNWTNRSDPRTWEVGQVLG